MKKINTIITTLFLLIIGVFLIGFVVYNTSTSPAKGNGVFYSTSHPGYYLQFKDDKTFVYAYDPKMDSNADTSSPDTQAFVKDHGVWSETKEYITLVFDNNSKNTFIKHDGLIYNKDTIYNGIYTEDKLINKTYSYKPSDDIKNSIILVNDGTVISLNVWGKTQITTQGTYTRNGDIITVRYKGSASVAHKFLMTKDGLASELFVKDIN